MTRVLVAGGGGFIGGHLVRRLLSDGDDVVVVDIKDFDAWYLKSDEAENHVADLSKEAECRRHVGDVDIVVNLAADMGGMGFIEANKALCMLSVLINTHLLMAAKDSKVAKYFFASSACVYAAEHQTEAAVQPLREDDAYPADPEDGYGWEKLFSERMCRHFCEDFGLPTTVARFHNVYGPHGTWFGGREKAPAAICRKIAVAKSKGETSVEVWGDGEQTRSFMYVDDCVEGISRFLRDMPEEPLNLGSSELTTINGLVDLVADIAGIRVDKIHDLSAPKGVRGRNSDNTLINKTLGWEPQISLRDGMTKTYEWVESQVRQYPDLAQS